MKTHHDDIFDELGQGAAGIAALVILLAVISLVLALAEGIRSAVVVAQSQLAAWLLVVAGLLLLGLGLSEALQSPVPLAIAFAVASLVLEVLSSLVTSLSVGAHEPLLTPWFGAVA